MKVKTEELITADSMGGVEDDFKFISTNGLNAVRIPVGWWIASDPSPPEPYVSGSLETLDNAFLAWAGGHF
ncbi:hypothetical protein Leryth_011418 [Lithospermum erythrorhizon]|nr:hypothetical protein Leryth_011418 [Lithospermum erythrorhizon]